MAFIRPSYVNFKIISPLSRLSFGFPSKVIVRCSYSLNSILILQLEQLNARDYTDFGFLCRNGASNSYFISTIKLHNTILCLFLYRNISCLTNNNLINIVNLKIDRILPLVPRVENLIKQVELLSLQLTAKFEKLPKDFRNPNIKEYSQQLKRTAETTIITASTIIAP